MALDWIPLFSSSLALIYAAGELAVKRKTERTWLLFGIFAGLSLVLLHAGLLTSGRIRSLPHLFQTNLPITFALGPFIFRYFLLVLGSAVPSGRRFAVSLLPAALSILIMLPRYLQSASQKLQLIEAFYDSPRLQLFGMLFLIGVAHFAFYMGLAVRSVLFVFRWENLRTEPTVRVVLFIGGSGMLICAIAVVGFLSSSVELLTVSVYLISAIVPALYLVRRRFPQFFVEFEAFARKEKYRQSQLGNVDIADLALRLEQAMREEHLYREEDLSLATLAAHAGVTPHQLSEYFNKHLESNFSGYVNRLRIEEARRILSEEPDRTVLSVAYAVGFNSKSTFNAAFARFSGQSPSAFRRAQRAGARSK